MLKRTSTHYVVSIPFSTQATVYDLPPSNNWIQYVNGLSRWERQILQDTTDDISQLWTDLLQPHAAWSIVSDGSYSNNTAAYAWTITHKNNPIKTSVAWAAGQRSKYKDDRVGCFIFSRPIVFQQRPFKGQVLLHRTINNDIFFIGKATLSQNHERTSWWNSDNIYKLSKRLRMHSSSIWMPTSPIWIANQNYKNG